MLSASQPRQLTFERIDFVPATSLTAFSMPAAFDAEPLNKLSRVRRAPQVRTRRSSQRHMGPFLTVLGQLTEQHARRRGTAPVV